MILWSQHTTHVGIIHSTRPRLKRWNKAMKFTTFIIVTIPGRGQACVCCPFIHGGGSVERRLAEQEEDHCFPAEGDVTV
jgi:hypothetical protein